jgi:hypothetical protein
MLYAAITLGLTSDKVQRPVTHHTQMLNIQQKPQWLRTKWLSASYMQWPTPSSQCSMREQQAAAARTHARSLAESARTALRDLYPLPTACCSSGSTHQLAGSVLPSLPSCTPCTLVLQRTSGSP